MKKEKIKILLDNTCLQIIARQSAEIKSGEYNANYNYDALYYLFDTMRGELLKDGVREFKKNIISCDPVKKIKEYTNRDSLHYYLLTYTQELTTRQLFNNFKRLVLED